MGHNRTRSFTGCYTCRRRHVRCDEVRPSCLTCRRQHIKCQGYETRLQWVSQQDNSAKGKSERRQGSYRAPLFSDSVRDSMSQALITSIGLLDAGEVAAELDAIPTSNDDVHSLGPFGVFRVAEGEDLPTECTSPRVDFDCTNDQPAFDVDEEIGAEHTQSWQEVLGLVDMDMEFNPFSFGSGLPAYPDWTTSHGSLDVDVEQFNTHQIESSVVNCLEWPSDPEPRPGPMASVRSSVIGQIANPPPATKHPTSPPTRIRSRQEVPRSPRNMVSSTDILTTATPLLRYFRSEVLGESLEQHYTRVSPWKTLLLPYALEAYAELSIWKTASHTRQCILSTVLSKSAFHVHQSEASDSASSSKWLRIARDHQMDALRHLKYSLQEEAFSKSPVPYAEVLVAILSLGLVSVYFHGTQYVKELLLHAERLIRLRGLPANISYSARILHHMYAHLRVLSESTNQSTLVTENPQQSFAIHKPDSKMALTTVHRFRLARNNLGDLDILRNKPEEVGYADIHLDATGVWLPTLFPDMYGIPESVMTLLSQTISLANAKPKLEEAAKKDPLVGAALAKHTRSLEDCIWTVIDGGHGPDKALTIVMQQALLIYFYRRIYNLSARMLQHHVQQLLDNVAQCIDTAKHDQDYGASMGWACFMAASEAVKPDLQEQGMEFVNRLCKRGVFFGIEQPEAIVRSVWLERNKAGSSRSSWMDVMLENA